MRALLTFVAVILGIVGVVLVISGTFYPDGFRLSSASAPQVAQVYSEATFQVAQGVAALVIAVLFGVVRLWMDQHDAHVELLGKLSAPPSPTAQEPTTQEVG